MLFQFVILFLGIGFDATCSLVALDNEDKPITVSPTGTRLTAVKFDSILSTIGLLYTIFSNRRT
jgi:hypothetical protein